MLERLAWIIYFIGIIPSGGLLSAGLIERQKRHKQQYALRRRINRSAYYDDGIKYKSVNKNLDPADRTITRSERQISMAVGYLAGIAWPALGWLGIVGTIVSGIGFVGYKVSLGIGLGIGKVATTFGRNVLDPTTRKFETRIEQRTLAPKPQLEARPLGNLEKLKS